MGPDPGFWVDGEMTRGSCGVFSREAGPMMANELALLLVAKQGEEGGVLGPAWSPGRDV